MSINAKSVNFVLTRNIETPQNRPPVFHNILREYRFTSDLDNTGLRHDYTFAINKADSGK